MVAAPEVHTSQELGAAAATKISQMIVATEVHTSHEMGAAGANISTGCCYRSSYISGAGGY